MRVWLDSDRISALGIGVDEITAAIRNQNVQASIGAIGSTPDDGSGQVVFTLTAQGRLNDTESFGNIVVRTGADGAVVYLKDVARIEKGSDNYLFSAKYNGAPCVALGLSRTPGSNALDTMDDLRTVMTRLEKDYPDGLESILPYDASEFVRTSIREIVSTLGLTFLLVVIVCYVFFAELACHADTIHHHSGLALRHLHGACSPWLQHQYADALWSCAGHRPGGRRCHRGG